MELSETEARDLMAAAIEARRNAYAPYSHFPVGAALLDDEGGVHTGVNVESASYGLTTCAERSAIAGAVTRGVRRFRAVAVVGPRDDVTCAPCGSCRQILYEFGPSMVVVMAGPGGQPRQTTVEALLPEAFGPSSLGDSGAGGSR
jgi:cytidine deaminase